jgi:hypothetical protein
MFGAVLQGSSRNQTFVVLNNGQQRSGPVRITLSGTDFALVTPSGTDCVNNATALDPNATCTVRVSFTPTMAVARSATLTVSATPGTAPSLTLSGTGQAPSALTIAPMTQGFGSIVVGGVSPRFTFTVTNTGDVGTGTLATSITGEFAIAVDNCNGIALAGHAPCTIGVTFNPVAPPALSKAGTLTITANPGGPISASLSGRGLALGLLRLTPTTATFDPTLVNAVSASRSFTVTNGGEAPTGPITVSSGGANPTDFSLDSNTCGPALGAGLTCTIVVIFRPAAAGARSATLNVTAMPGGTQTATLSGTGLTGAVLTLAGAGDFGPFPINTSRDQTFVLSNGGTQAAAGITVNVSGSDFSRLTGATGDCGATLAGSTPCNIRVRFTPSVFGARTATLTVTATTGGNPAPIALRGTGIGIQPIPLPTGSTTSGGSVDISTDGATVAGSASGQAYIWTVGGASPRIIAPLGAFDAQYTHLGRDGQVVVGCSLSADANGNDASDVWMWTAAVGVQHLGAPPFQAGSPPQQAYTACPNAVSSLTGGPTIVGGANDVLGQVNLGFYWTQGGLFQFFNAPYNEWVAHGVTPDGNIAVGEGHLSVTGFDDALLWRKSGATFQASTVLPPTSSGAVAQAISPDGFVAAGLSSSTQTAVRWSGAGFSVMQNIAPTFGYGLSLSQNGSIVVGYAISAGAFQAFIWNGAFQSMDAALTAAGVNVSGWVLQFARGVSGDGKTVVGDGTFNGTSRSWIARLP